MKKLFRFLRHEKRGVALIEMAFVAPVLALLFLGGVELSRYILINEKAVKASYVLDDTLSRFKQSELTDTNINQVFDQYKTIMSPYDNDAQQSAIFTVVWKDPGDHNIKVTLQKAGGGSLNDDKTVSTVNQRDVSTIRGSTLPAGMLAKFSGDTATQLTTMNDDENIVISEVFYHYQPISASVLQSLNINIVPTTVVHRTFLHPRNDLSNPAAADCKLPWGGSLPDGQSITAYASASVPCGQACQFEQRNCKNGALSGSYTNQNCTVLDCPVQCGSASGSPATYGSPPAENLCANGGTASAVTDDGFGNYVWTCTSGADHANCSAAYCDVSHLHCTPPQPNPNPKTAPQGWFCCDVAPWEGCFEPMTCSYHCMWEPLGKNIQCVNGSTCQHLGSAWPMPKCEH